MYYYAVYNENICKITTDSKEYNNNLKKKTCHKRFRNKTEAEHFLKTFDKYFTNKYNAFIDFEFTCSTRLEDFLYPQVQGEVLSVGICITDNKGEIIDNFYRTVCPKFNKTLTKYCIDLTHLSQEQIDKSKDLPTILMEASSFIKKYNIQKMNAYGTTDYMQSKIDVQRFTNNQNYKKMIKFVNKITNIQREITKCLINQRIDISLEDSKKLCGIAGSVKHNAISDANDLSRVLFATFFNPPSDKKINNYLDERAQRIKYNQARRIKKFQRDYTQEEKDEFKDVCNLIAKSCDVNDIKIKSLIDDLLYLSKQKLMFQ